MKQTVLTLILLFLTAFANAQEITLYDYNGNARAYIDANNSAMPIYLWDGEPVAYLKSGRGGTFSIYGFNGNHLGWFEDGLVIDHDGYVCGFVKGALSKATSYEPYKGYKQYLPYKSYAEYEPYKPYRQSYFSNTPLTLFLRQGR